MAVQIDHEYIYNSSPDMCVSIDPHTGLIIACNQTVLRILGYSKAEVIGASVIKMYHPSEADKVKANLQSFKESGRITHQDFKLLKKDGAIIEVHLKFTPVKDEAGNILYSNAVWRDVTELKSMQRELQAKNKDIMDSINYAEKIQRAILPQEAVQQKSLPESFILFRPKDVVSGDFYWIHPDEDHVSFAAIDCTGHGVPGAFMSMIGSALFNQVVTDLADSKPGLVLDGVRAAVMTALKQGANSSSKDGMDASLCRLHKKTKVLEFAGANNPLYLIRSKNSPLHDSKGAALSIAPNMELDDFDVYEIKGDKQPIGFYTESDQAFTTHQIQLLTNDRIYLSTDGFPDQFGGPKGKKYKYKPFKKLLSELCLLPMAKQHQRLTEELDQWMGQEHEQIDDICILGIKI